MYLDETVDLKTFEEIQKKSNSKIETFKLKITGKGQKDCFIEEYND